jgi:hypothetical protein
MSCDNHLKQIGFGLLQYEDRYGALPPAYTVDADGKPLHSWRTLILPFMEQEELYKQIDLSKPWDDPANMAAFDISLRIYRCPNAKCPPNHTTYLAIAVPGGCFRPGEPRALSEIAHPNSTLMVTEVDAQEAVPWMSPLDATERCVQKLGTKAMLPHPGGAEVLRVDGSVFHMRAGTKPEIIRALITIDSQDDTILEAGY